MRSNRLLRFRVYVHAHLRGMRWRPSHLMSLWGSRSSSVEETTTSQRQASGGGGRNAVEPEHNLCAPFPGGPIDGSLLKSYKDHVAASIWDGDCRPLLKS
ncbi:hypothetical protein Scep_012327 [Stephania cephalantha]|uniref:Uncharacterized protein n=1 Tax=Stephania cephalantha TaxID=152367 RepID=A0AAP0JEY6_9MAGN